MSKSFHSSKKIIAIYKRSFIHLCAGQIFLPSPPMPRMPRGQRKNVCDKKGGTLQTVVIWNSGAKKKLSLGGRVGLRILPLLSKPLIKISHFFVLCYQLDYRDKNIQYVYNRGVTISKFDIREMISTLATTFPGGEGWGNLKCECDQSGRSKGEKVVSCGGTRGALGQNNLTVALFKR